MQRRAKLFEAPEIGKGNMLFTLKDIIYTPETPRLKEPFTVKGTVELFKIPFLAPIWVQVRVTYPEAWWEEIIPIIGSPTVAEGAMVIGGDFEITFPRGFEREGEFLLNVEVYAGPTYSVDKITLPPFPPITSEETTFIVGGEIPPEEIGFGEFRILSYSKNGGPPVMPPGVLELDIGDRCRVNVGFDHMDGAVTGEFHAAIWQDRPWDPHDEILHADKTFTVPSSPDWEPWEGYIDIIITSAISPGTEYGLYVKIMGITGGDIFTEYLANVITIKGVAPMETLEVRIDPVGAGYVTVSPTPAGGTQHNWLFPYGTTVYVTAHRNPGYVFDGWSGEMTDTPEITAPVYPMTEHRLITAHFKTEEVVPLGFEMLKVLIDGKECTKKNKAFTGNLIPKVSYSGLVCRPYDEINVEFQFTWGGPSITVELEISSGKKGIWGDYDQESEPQLFELTIPANSSTTVRPIPIPLNFWGDRSIDDCAVEIVLRAPGIANDLVVHVWDAYMVNQEIELEPGSNYVVWTDGPILIDKGLGECLNYLEALYMYNPATGNWMQITTLHTALLKDYVYGIVVSRSCKLRNFVWQ